MTADSDDGGGVRAIGAVTALAAAFGHSFSFDVALGYYFGVYTSVYAALTWSIIGSLCLIAALRLRAPKWAVVGAYGLFGGLALLGGLVGHRFNFLVGL